MYLVNVELGHAGMPGAPILRLNLGVDAPTGRIHGTGEITQAIQGPASRITIPNVTGSVQQLDAGMLRVVTLSGTFSPVPTEPLIQQFSATFFIHEDSWDGTGSFSYGGHHVTGVPVKVIELSDASTNESSLAGSSA